MSPYPVRAIPRLYSERFPIRNSIRPLHSTIQIDVHTAVLSRESHGLVGLVHHHHVRLLVAVEISDLQIVRALRGQLDSVDVRALEVSCAVSEKDRDLFPLRVSDIE